MTEKGERSSTAPSNNNNNNNRYSKNRTPRSAPASSSSSNGLRNRSRGGHKSANKSEEIDLDNLERSVQQQEENEGESTYIELEDEVEDDDHDYDTPPPPPVPPRSASSSTYPSPPPSPSSPSSATSNHLRRVDYVLVYRNTRSDEASLEAPVAFKAEAIRATYEAQLEREGLVLAHVDSTVGNEYVYVHIYAPWETLARYAEVMALRMPMRTVVSRLNELFEEEEEEDWLEDDRQQGGNRISNRYSAYFGITSPRGGRVFTTTFSRDKEYLFAIPATDREDFFSPSQRSEIIDFILRRTTFDPDLQQNAFSIGINKLLADGVYVAVYPLHDESADCDQKNCPTTRCRLKSTWATIWRCWAYQPFEDIVDYLGVKLAMYYAWVGFYTYMLLFIAVPGLVTVLGGYLQLAYWPPVREICSHADHLLLCPSCVINCNYSRVSESCFEAKTTHLFGNFFTVVFAVWTCLWATFFLEYWKRYSAGIAFSWDLSEYSIIEEYPRPEFLNSSRFKRRHRHPITKLEEPYISFLHGRLPYFLISSSFVVLCIVVALLIMVAIIVYRVSIQIALYTTPDQSAFWSRYADNVVMVTAAFINLLLIMLLSWVYKRLAYFLTELEMPRTQAEFDNSLTLKMFLFEFVNYYSSFFYIAFVKGKIRAEPPEGGLQKSTTVSTYLGEPCPLVGCYHDLAIQMIIIFVGKALLNSLFEYLGPYLKSLYNRHQYLGFRRRRQRGKPAGGPMEDAKSPSPKGDTETGEGEQPKKLQQWEEDFMLESWDHMSLFYEYLELVIQFGFVTIFVSAYPLAPLFALINNVFEIRLDARKMILNYKRPVAQRVKDIGIWYSILDAIGKLSVFTSSMIISFTTDIVPQLVYFVQNGNLVDYFDSTMSIYEIKPEDLYPPNNATNCLYRAYRQPPWVYDADGLAYQETRQHWIVLVSRIVFVVVFQNVVAGINSLLKVTIADVPRSVLLSKRRHAYLTNELIIRHELISKAAAAAAKRKAENGGGGKSSNGGGKAAKGKAAAAAKRSANSGGGKRRPPPPPQSSSSEAHLKPTSTRF